MTLLFVLVVAGATVSGCVSQNWHVVQVTERNPRLLALDIASCNATYDVDVQETPQEVRVILDQLTPTDPPGAECADELTVALDDPIEDRTVLVNGKGFEVNLPH